MFAHERRFITPAVVILAATFAACAGDAAEEAEVDPAIEATVPAAPAAPADLAARGEAFEQAWNQDDAAVLGAYFAEDAVVTQDTMTFTGRQQIQEQFLAGLSELSNMQVSDETWTAEGADFRSAGRYSYTAATPEGDTPMTGRYESVWTQGADGQWVVRTMTVYPDAAPAATTGA